MSTNPGLSLRGNSQHSLALLTSMGMRYTPKGRQPSHCADVEYFRQATSAETNVGSISSYLGLSVDVMTALVVSSPHGHFIKHDLLGRGMTLDAKEVVSDDPWGPRHQINFADSGYGPRRPSVDNDRAGEVARDLEVEDFDLDRKFVEEGADILHLSGVIAALSPKTGRLCLAAARKAKENGTLVSFDLNHRASFWVGREEELRKLFLEIAALSDILVGNEEDFQLCLGVEGPAAGGEGLDAKIDGFKEMIERARVQFPNAKLFATTLREVLSANRHRWGAIVWYDGEWTVAEPRDIDVLDRIGGGDGFVGGLLYAILKGWDSKKWIQFAWASGALAATYLTDYAQPFSEDEIWAIWKGNARVKR